MSSIFDDDFCPVAEEYERLLKVSGQEDARRYLARQLRGGHNSARIRAIVADAVDPDFRVARGRRKGSHLDSIWHNVGRDFDDLIKAGCPAGKAYAALAEEYAVGERTIQQIVSDYRIEMQAAHDQINHWEQEFDSGSEDDQRDYHRERAEALEEAKRQASDAEPRQFDAADWEFEIRAALERCSHGCGRGCRRSHLLNDRYRCPFSASPRNQMPI